jgi:hypothetical protein
MEGKRERKHEKVWGFERFLVKKREKELDMECVTVTLSGSTIWELGSCALS